MGSSRTITLFSVQAEERQRVSSIVVSAVAHVAVAVLVTIGVFQSKIGTPIPETRFELRQLDLETPREALRSAAKEVEYQAPKKAPSAPSKAGHPQMQAPALREMVKVEHGPQTLIQPDIKTHVALQKLVPVPALAIWQPVKVAVNKIVAPLPHPEVELQTNPALNPPNQALTVRNLEISPSDLSNEKLPIVASTTTPLALAGRDLPAPAPLTASKSSSQPTPATVVSLSNLSMLNGKVVLPPINESESRSTPGVIGAGAGKETANAERGPGAGSKAGEGAAKSDNGNGSHSGPGEGSGSISGSGSLTVAHVTMPAQGHFGAVVVGNAVADQFPEVGNTWNNRIAYTVYLHVGLDKSWIMQYSLPRVAEVHAAGKGEDVDAPWPYSIVRPNLTPGSIDGDALLVHGYVNKLGHFESLSIAFPPDFSEGPFVLGALQQWQFRPAKQNGQAAKVEILLIIPESVYETRSAAPQTASAVVRTAPAAAVSVYTASGFRVFGSGRPDTSRRNANPADGSK